MVQMLMQSFLGAGGIVLVYQERNPECHGFRIVEDFAV